MLEVFAASDQQGNDSPLTDPPYIYHIEIRPFTVTLTIECSLCITLDNSIHLLGEKFFCGVNIIILLTGTLNHFVCQESSTIGHRQPASISFPFSSPTVTLWQYCVIATRRRRANNCSNTDTRMMMINYLPSLFLVVIIMPNRLIIINLDY